MKKFTFVLVVCMLLLLCACKSADTPTEPSGTTATLPAGDSDWETPIDVDDGVTTPGNGQPSTTKPGSNGGNNKPIELPMIPG